MVARILGRPLSLLRTGTGTLTGTYQWVVSYSGDPNNNSAVSIKGEEPVTVVAASPTNPTSSRKLAAQASPGGRHRELRRAANGRSRAARGSAGVTGERPSMRSMSLRKEGPGA